MTDRQQKLLDVATALLAAWTDRETISNSEDVLDDREALTTAAVEWGALLLTKVEATGDAP